MYKTLFEVRYEIFKDSFGNGVLIIIKDKQNNIDYSTSFQLDSTECSTFGIDIYDAPENVIKDVIAKSTPEIIPRMLEKLIRYESWQKEKNNGESES